jgi:hypothetical protein
MKKLIPVMVAAILVPILVASPVFAKAEKVDLKADPRNYPELAGEGFVVFNNSSGEHNLEVTVSLKNADIETLGVTELDVYLYVKPGPSVKIGTMTLNGKGNGNFHANYSVPSGPQELALVLTKPLSMANVYRAPPYISAPATFVQMTFK